MGCARNEVDTEEMAGRLAEGGFELVADGDPADLVVVNTCGFIEQAKKDSIDTLLAASDTGAKVVAVGCLAERYGAELAKDLPEADAVLGFDHYPELADRLQEVMAGTPIASHTPADRRLLLPISPVERPKAAAEVAVPGHAWGPASRVVRRRLDDAPVAPLKLASGCDRRCSFCAIPSFRGSFVSRGPAEVLAEGRWLAEHGVRELYLVSENSTSYGKDLGDTTILEALLGELAAIPGIDRVRLSYLQPAETRPALLRAVATTPGVARYFDLSFQHASGPVLRRMRRFGDRESFLELCAQIRALAPEAGIRTNVIVGFPGETEEDLVELEQFLIGARLDAVGVFGYSDEDGTEAVDLDGHVDPAEVNVRVQRISSLVDELTSQRAEDRIGTEVVVLVERDGTEDLAEMGEGEVGLASGRAEHQAPEVDGECVFTEVGSVEVGELVRARVVGSDGVDLVVEALEVIPPEQPVQEETVQSPELGGQLAATGAARSAG